MIGSAAGLSFLDFVANTGLAVVFVLAAMLVCFYFIYGRKAPCGGGRHGRGPSAG